MEPKRLRILQALSTILEGITVNNGYGVDVKGVYRGRAVFGANTPLPAISLIEPNKTDYGDFADENLMVRKDKWLVLVQGWVEDDPENPTDPAYRLAAAIEKRLSDVNNPKIPGSFRLRGLISGLTMAQPVCRPPEDAISSKAFCFLPIIIGLESDLTNPYA